MQKYLIRRLLQLIPLLLGISFVSFLIVLSAPGDPIATLYPRDTIKNVPIEVIREQLGLNRPIPVQYVKMMSSLLRGELKSFQEARSTVEMVRERLPMTLIFATLALAVTLLIGLPIAIFSATHPYSRLDNALVVGSLLGMSIPDFWLGLMLILVVAERLRLLPATGLRPLTQAHYTLLQTIPYYIMPTLVLAVSILPGLVRYARSSMLDVMTQDYVRTARGKGLRERQVITHHALKNALIPVVSWIGIVIPYLLGGSVVVESVFALPGLGRLAVKAAGNRDYPLVLTINMFMAFLVVLSSLIADLCYSALDPRIRQG